MQILQPPGWAPPIGYSNGIATGPGRVVFVAGQIGWDADQVFHSADLAPQFDQALANVLAVLAEAGCGYEDILESTLYVVDLQANTDTMFKVKDEFIQEPYSATTWIGITELAVPGGRAEIKVTARKPR